jgi:hypothetical protein
MGGSYVDSPATATGSGEESLPDDRFLSMSDQECCYRDVAADDQDGDDVAGGAIKMDQWANTDVFALIAGNQTAPIGCQVLRIVAPLAIQNLVVVGHRSKTVPDMSSTLLKPGDWIRINT